MTFTLKRRTQSKLWRKLHRHRPTTQSELWKRCPGVGLRVASAWHLHRSQRCVIQNGLMRSRPEQDCNLIRSGGSHRQDRSRSRPQQECNLMRSERCPGKIGLVIGIILLNKRELMIFAKHTAVANGVNSSRALDSPAKRTAVANCVIARMALGYPAESLF
mgnify:CR=1 FL=1